MLDFLQQFCVTGDGGFFHFAFQRDFAFSNFGGVFGIEFGQFFLLGGGQFDGGSGFVESLHGEFVGAFHIANLILPQRHRGRRVKNFQAESRKLRKQGK